MTNFEKLKSMTQDEVVAYIRDGLCEMYNNCEGCPMLSEHFGAEDCVGDIFADWLEMEIEKE